MERLPGVSHDRIRYSKDLLLEFRVARTEAPEELVSSGIEVLYRALTTAGAGSSSDKLETYSGMEVILKVNGILSKLVMPEDYDVPAKQMLQAGITSGEILQAVISFIFDKAVLEPSVCAMYAQLCVHLSKELPEFPGEQPGDKPMTFRRVLLNMCQDVFEGAEALREEIKKLTKPEQAVERDEKEKRAKLWTLGNLKLIGELFKQKMLPEKIVHACIQELLGQDPKAIPAEENVEALCPLFTTVGKQLEESAKSKMAFDTYFARLKLIGESRALPLRIRFMVRDVLHTRSNKWVTRREISEIHAEAEAGTMPGMQGGCPAQFSSSSTRGGSGGYARMLSRARGGYGFMGARSPKSVAAAAPSADLTKKSESLLKEYFSIVDLNEALICVQELKSPSFHPEFVRLAIVTALDMREKECSLVLKLLLHLQSNG